MRRSLFLTALPAAVLLLTRPAAADVPKASPVPPAAEAAVLPPDWRADLLAQWKTPRPTGGVEATADGVKLVTRVQPEHLYGLEAQIRNRVPVKKGDTMLLRFAARSVKADKATGVTKIGVSFSKASPPWNGSHKSEIGLTSEWTRYDIPFTCKDDFGPGEARFNVTFGYPPQEAEIADVQLLRYGPEVAVSSLPKTKRQADPVSPEALKRELERIAALKRALDSVKDPAPANGRTLHVAKTGAAAGDGSKNRPFATIPQALAVAKPGDTVLVGAGEYREPQGVSVKTSGRPDAWIKIKAAPGARPKLVTSGWSGFDLRGGIAYIEIQGFELQWVKDPAVVGENGGAVHGSGVAPAYATHHIRILDNVIHGYGTGGISALDCDYLHIEGNVLYDNAKTSPYGGSAISLCRAFDADDDPGYHNVIRGNVCYDNELRVVVQESSGGNGRTLTDGNGIIIDVFKRGRVNPLRPHHDDKDGPLVPYRGRTLVENNLIYDNGGRGIHVFRSEKVDVLNNTCYRNQKSADINAGEFTANESGEVVFLNNIAVGRKEKRGNSQDGSTRVVWAGNLFFDAEDVLLHEGILQADPLFVRASTDPKAADFRLRPGSPAIDAGVRLPAAAPPGKDLSGAPRVRGKAPDLGAYEH